MSTYNNGPGNVPRLPDPVVDTLIGSAGVSCLDYANRNQYAKVVRLVHDVCEELLARLPVTAPVANTLDELAGALKRNQTDNIEALLKAWMEHTGCRVDEAVLVQQVTFENGVASNRYWFERKDMPTLAPAHPRYTCVGKGGSYELLGEAIFAGELKNFSPIIVYRDVSTGQLFARSPVDFEVRMQKLEVNHA